MRGGCGGVPPFSSSGGRGLGDGLYKVEEAVDGDREVTMEGRGWEWGGRGDCGGGGIVIKRSGLCVAHLECDIHVGVAGSVAEIKAGVV